MKKNKKLASLEGARLSTISKQWASDPSNSCCDSAWYSYWIDPGWLPFEVEDPPDIYSVHQPLSRIPPGYHWCSPFVSSSFFSSKTSPTGVGSWTIHFKLHSQLPQSATSQLPELLPEADLSRCFLFAPPSWIPYCKSASPSPDTCCTLDARCGWEKIAHMSFWMLCYEPELTQKMVLLPGFKTDVSPVRQRSWPTRRNSGGNPQFLSMRSTTCRKRQIWPPLSCTARNPVGFSTRVAS